MPPESRRLSIDSIRAIRSMGHEQLLAVRDAVQSVDLLYTSPITSSLLDDPSLKILQSDSTSPGFVQSTYSISHSQCVYRCPIISRFSLPSVPTAVRQVAYILCHLVSTDILCIERRRDGK